MHAKSLLVILFVLLARLSLSTPPQCGDSTISGPLEQCESGNLAGKTCGSFCYTGTLGCTNCRFDFTGCTENSCGDGVALRSEQCDTSDLKGNTCTSLGFSHGGTLRCTSGCHFDTSACCGDAQIGGTETCDTTNLNGTSCTSLGYAGGTLACKSDCSAFDTTACCGDGTIGGSEQCDGSNLNGQSCTSLTSPSGLNYVSGTLGCTSSCTFNTASCNQKDCTSGTYSGSTITTVLQIAQCYEAGIVPSGSMSTVVTPSSSILSGIQTLVNNMLNNDGNCASITVPSALSGVMMVKPFTDSGNNVTYCVAIDTASSTGTTYSNGYMLFITPNNRADVHRRLHLASAHTGADSGVTGESARVFISTGANSLLVHGIHQKAAASGTSTCHSTAYATDANEDDRWAFHAALMQITSTSSTNGWDSYYWQFHGALGTPTGCSFDIILSYGVSSSTYYPSSGDLISGINATLHSPGYTSYVVGYPPMIGSTCNSLIGTSSIQGRVVNGVTNPCTTSASVPTKRYVHVEQKSGGPRAQGANPMWTDAIVSNIGCDCASPKTCSTTTHMCV